MSRPETPPVTGRHRTAPRPALLRGDHPGRSDQVPVLPQRPERGHPLGAATPGSPGTPRTLGGTAPGRCRDAARHALARAPAAPPGAGRGAARPPRPRPGRPRPAQAPLRGRPRAVLVALVADQPAAHPAARCAGLPRLARRRRAGRGRRGGPRGSGDRPGQPGAAAQLRPHHLRGRHGGGLGVDDRLLPRGVPPDGAGHQGAGAGAGAHPGGHRGRGLGRLRDAPTRSRRWSSSTARRTRPTRRVSASCRTAPTSPWCATTTATG